MGTDPMEEALERVQQYKLDGLIQKLTQPLLSYMVTTTWLSQHPARERLSKQPVGRMSNCAFLPKRKAAQSMFKLLSRTLRGSSLQTGSVGNARGLNGRGDGERLALPAMLRPHCCQLRKSNFSTQEPKSRPPQQT